MSSRVKMSLVITPSRYRSRIDLQRQSTRAVFPEPTGPPIPILIGFRIVNLYTTEDAEDADSVSSVMESLPLTIETIVNADIAASSRRCPSRA